MVPQSQNPRDAMMTKAELTQVNQKTRALYIWNNYWTDQTDPTGTKYAYKGQMLRKKVRQWEGIGEIKLPNGALYQGQTKNQIYNGKGRLTHPNGDIYQGEWVDGKAHNNGCFAQFAEGSLYDGDWHMDAMHGRGKLLWDFGKCSYEGDFENGQRTGEGVYKKGIETYTGSVKDGQFHGDGTYVFDYSQPHEEKNQVVYEGIFKNHKIISGTKYFADGSIYQGEFQDYNMHGGGSIQYPNGTVYIGTF